MALAHRGLVALTLVGLVLVSLPAFRVSAAEPEVTTGAPPRLVVQAGHLVVADSVVFSPDGRRLLSGDLDNVAILWDVLTGKELRRFREPADSLLSSISFTNYQLSPDGRFIFSQHQELLADGPSRLWDVASGREIRSWDNRVRPLDVAFSADGRRMASVGLDQHLRVWELASGRELRAFRCFDEKWFAAQGQQRSGWFSTWKPVVKLSRQGGYLFTEAPNGVGVVWHTPSGRVVHRLQGQLGRVTRASFSSDDALLAVAGEGGTVGLWNVANGRFQRSLVGHHGAIKDIQFSSNRRRITTFGDASDGTLRIWDTATGAQLAWFRTYYPTLAVGYAPDGRHAASGHVDGAVRIWELAGERQTRKLVGHAAGVKSLEFSANGKWLFTHGQDNTARVWDLAAGREARRIPLRRGDGWSGNRGIGATAFSADGGTIALGGGDGVVRLFDRQSGRERGTISTGDHVGGPIMSLAFTRDGTRLLAVGSVGTGLFAVVDGTKIRSFGNLNLPPVPPLPVVDSSPPAEPSVSDEAPRGPCPRVAALPPSGNFVVTGEFDGEVRLWNSTTGELSWKASSGPNRSPVSLLVVSPDERWVLASSEHGESKLIAVDSGKGRRFAGSVAIVAAEFSPDGKRCLTASASGTEEWDLASGKVVRRLRNAETDTVADVRVLAGDRAVVVGTEGGAEIWNSLRGDGRRKLLPTGFLAVSPAAVSRDGRTVAMAVADEQVEPDLLEFQSTLGLWNSADGRRLRTFGPKAHVRWALSGGVSPDGRTIETITYGGAARWQVDPMRLDFKKGNFGGALRLKARSAIASPDGRNQLEIERDDGLCMYDREMRRQRWRLAGFKAGSNALGFSGDGRFLIVGLGNTARRLNANTGEELRRFDGHTGQVIAVAADQDGERVATLGADNTVRVWDMDRAEAAHRFAVPRDFGPPPPPLPSDSGKAPRFPIWHYPAFASPPPQHHESDASEVFPAPASTAPPPPGTEDAATAAPKPPGRDYQASATKNDDPGIIAIAADGLWTAAARGVQVHVWSVAGEESHADGAESPATFSERDAGNVAALSFSHDGRWLAVGYRRRHVVLLETATGREVSRCEGDMGDLTTLSFSPDDRFLLTAGTDGMAHLWDPAKGEELCALVSFDDGNWAVFDREWRYDSSQEGEFDGLHWVVDNKPLDLVKFKDRFYEPGLLAKKLRLNDEPLREVGDNQETSR